MRLSEVAEVEDSNVDLRNAAIAQGEPAVLVTVFRQPGANIIETVDRIKAQLPKLAAALPNDVELIQASDRSNTIRASLADTELTLALAVVLVVGVVFCSSAIGARRWCRRSPCPCRSSAHSSRWIFSAIV